MKKKGITLIELIIVLALYSIVLSTTYTIFGVGNKIITKAEIQEALQAEAENIQSDLIYFLGTASQVLSINNVNSEEIYYKDLISSKNKDEVEKLTINSIEIGYADDSIIRIYLINNQLKYYIVDKDNSIIQPEKTISYCTNSFYVRPSDIRQVTNLDKCTFKDAKGIQVNINLKKNKGYSMVEYPISTVINFRN